MTKKNKGAALSYLPENAMTVDELREHYAGARGEVHVSFVTILRDVYRERHAQGAKHPRRTPRHCTDKYLAYTIAAEEFGEVAKALMDETPQEVYLEAVQTIACLVAMLEGMVERGEVK